MNKKFFDSDHEIELASGLRISDFFTKFGEKEFRKLEKKIITKLINQNKNIILSTGAGFLSDIKFNEFIFSESLCIFLSAKIDTLHQRLIGNIRNRPKLNEGNLRENLNKMYPRSRKIVVCGAMAELGDENINLHQYHESSIPNYVLDKLSNHYNKLKKLESSQLSKIKNLRI